MPDNKYSLEDILAEFSSKSEKKPQEAGSAEQDNIKTDNAKKTDEIKPTTPIRSAVPKDIPKAAEKKTEQVRPSAPVSPPKQKAAQPSSVNAASEASEKKKAETAVPSAPAATPKPQAADAPALPKTTEQKPAAVQPAEIVKTSSDNTAENKKPDPPDQSDNPVRNRPDRKRSPEQLKFLFKQLVKRDFKGRYKRAVLGMLWSMLSPLLTFAAQAILFSALLKRTNHFIAYLVIGNIVFHYFTDSAHAGMVALAANGGIISKINVPKGIFIMSKHVSCILNFALTMIVMFIIVIADHITPHPVYFALAYPIFTMSVFNIGFGMILSVWFIFFKDTQYLFNLFATVLMYFSAIFYNVDRFSETIQTLYLFNPVYCYITCFRSIILDYCMPSKEITILCAVYAVLMVAIGMAMYKKNHNKVAYYF